MSELKPCPFCAKEVDYAYNAEMEPYGVTCMNCKIVVRYMRIKHKGNNTFGTTMEKIAEAWNRRAE